MRKTVSTYITHNISGQYYRLGIIYIDKLFHSAQSTVPLPLYTLSVQGLLTRLLSVTCAESYSIINSSHRPAWVDPSAFRGFGGGRQQYCGKIVIWSGDTCRQQGSLDY